jgi:hypothetical protein
LLLQVEESCRTELTCRRFASLMLLDCDPEPLAELPVAELPVELLPEPVLLPVPVLLPLPPLLDMPAPPDPP